MITSEEAKEIAIDGYLQGQLDIVDSIIESIDKMPDRVLFPSEKQKFREILLVSKRYIKRP